MPLTRSSTSLKLKYVLSLWGVLFLVVGVGAAVFLNLSSQDLRQQASEGRDRSHILFGVGGYRSVFLDDAMVNDTIKNYGFTSLSSSPEFVMWRAIQGRNANTWNFEKTDRLVAYAEQNNLKLHLTALVWQDNVIPNWIGDSQTPISKELFKQYLKTYLQTYVGRYKGRVYSYDVVNEAFDENGQLRDTWFSRKLGEEYIELAFQWVHEADPNAKLFYNDYDIESAKGGKNKKAEAVVQLVRRLKAKGVPIDGVGFQTHLAGEGLNYTQREVADQMRKFKDMGVEVAISEIDVQIGTESPSKAQLDQQADVFRRMVTACAQSENCYRYTTWGLGDTTSWIRIMFGKSDTPLLFDFDLNPKPAFISVARALDLPQEVIQRALENESTPGKIRASVRRMNRPEEATMVREAGK